MEKPLYRSLGSKPTVSRCCRFLQVEFTREDLGAIGKIVGRKFRREYGFKPLIARQMEFGFLSTANKYPESFIPEMILIIRNYFDSKAQSPVKPYPTEEQQIGPTVVSEPVKRQRPRIKKVENVEPIRFSPSALLKNRSAK